MTSEVRRVVLTALGLNLAGALSVGLLLSLSHGQVETIAVVRSIAVSAVFSNLIGIPAWFLIGRAVDRMRPRGAVAIWTAVVVIVIALTAVGCAIAGLLFIAVGWFEADAYW